MSEKKRSCCYDLTASDDDDNDWTHAVEFVEIDGDQKTASTRSGSPNCTVTQCHDDSTSYANNNAVTATSNDYAIAKALSQEEEEEEEEEGQEKKTDNEDDDVQFIKEEEEEEGQEKKTDNINDDEVQFIKSTKPAAAASGAAAALGSSSNGDCAFVKVVSREENEIMSLTQEGGRSSKRSRHRFKCNICLEDDIDGRERYTIPKCNHSFCFTCLTSLIQSSIAGDTTTTTSARLNNNSSIKCPQTDCNTALTTSDVQFILRDNPKIWNMYTNAASMSLLETEITSDDSTTRRCPADRCNYTFVSELAAAAVNGTRFDCPMCHESFCLNCRANGGKVGPAHDDMTCTERIQQLEQEAEERRKFELWKQENAQADAKFQQLIQREGQRGQTKPCPKCKQLVTKNGGCNHMRCRCGHNYNWSSA